MKLKTIIISPTIGTIDVDLGQLIGTTNVLLPSATETNIDTTSSLVYENMYTAKYTVDVSGSITVTNIRLDITTDNSANGQSKFQISGDGGNTFVDMTDDTTVGLVNIFTDVGKWITNIQTGDDKLQFRILGRSTDGNPAIITCLLDTKAILTIYKRNQ